MKILVIGKFQTEMMGKHISETFEAMGHEVSRYRPGIKKKPGSNILGERWAQLKRLSHDLTGKLAYFRKRRTAELVEAVEEARPDLILSCHDFLSPDQVDLVREATDAVLALWFPDAMSNYGSAMFMGADYDVLFFKDPFVVNYLEGKLSKEVYFLPQCFRPDKHGLGGEPMTADERAKYACDITTAGNLYPYRQEIFRQLRDYEVKIWGSPPPTWMKDPVVVAMYQGEPVFDRDKALAFLGAKVVFNNMFPAEAYGVNKRTFEATGIGAFTMVDWNPGLSQLFKPGEEVETFRSMDEAHEKIRYYLERPEERDKIAAAGRERSLAEHTYENRLGLMLETIFGDEQAYPMPNLREACQGYEC